MASRALARVAQGPASRPMSTTSTLNRIPILEEDPYKAVKLLGKGAYGVVTKVECEGKVYARKTIIFSTGRDHEKTLRDTQSEFVILSRLKHKHIVEVVELFCCQKQLHIVMAQVADSNMKEFLEHVDGMGAGDERRDLLRTRMQMWPGCLIQAIDYLHEMRVKHKDLKPANILVMGDGQVLIADFGISKDVIDEETTASVRDAERRGTPMYWAPEIDPVREIDPSRRGRAVDIYALGCIFLEIATIFIAPPGSRAEFAQYRETDGSREYRRSPEKLLRWIWNLWWHWSESDKLHEKKKIPYDTFNLPGVAVNDLAFFMLDPDPKKRITARQLVTLVSSAAPELHYRDSIKKKACLSCSAGVFVDVSNVPLHSVYKPEGELKYPKRPGEALTTKSLPDWESAKREWLQQHMWW